MSDRPRLRQWPHTAITIPAGETENVPLGGKFCRVRTANVEFKITFDDDEPLTAEQNDVFEFDMNDGFNKITVFNDSGVDLTIQLQIGDGDIRTNNISLSGAQQVENKTGDVLEVDDPNTQSKLDDVISAIEKDISGSTHKERTTAGTNNVVTVGQNTNGVFIDDFQLIAEASNSKAELQIDGNTFRVASDRSGATTFNVVSVEGGGIRVAAGVTVDLIVTGSAASGYIKYRLLP